MPNITNITPPRVPLTDPATGMITREWYRFFFNLFNLTGGGQTDVTLQDLQLAPTDKSIDIFAQLSAIYDAALLAPRNELGTMAAVQQDNVRYLGFDTLPAFTDEALLPEGSVWWDSTGTLNLRMGNGNITQQIGDELFVYGKASQNITEGQVVAVTGSDGTTGVVKFEPAPIGTTDQNTIVGLATENIAKNSYGRVTAFGVVHDLSTAGLGDGTPIWYDPTVVGGYTITEPSAPNIKVQIGVVIKAAGGGNGSIQVKVIQGSKLGETDSNVQFTGLANNDLIQYYASGPYWRNAAPSSISIGTATNLAGGAAGSVPYQSTASTTTFLPIGTTSYIMTSTGSAPSWSQFLNTSQGGTGLTTIPEAYIPFGSTAPSTALSTSSTFFFDNANSRLGVEGTTRVYRPGILTQYVDTIVNANGTTIAAAAASGRINFSADGAATTPFWLASTAIWYQLDATVTLQYLLFGDNTKSYVRLISEYESSSASNFRINVYSGGTSNERFRVTSAGGIIFNGTGTGYGSSGDVLKSNGASSPSWVAPSTLSVGTATNLAGGAAGSIPYQSTAATTTFLSIGTTGFVMTSTGSAPSWAAQSTLSVGSAATLTTPRAIYGNNFDGSAALTQVIASTYGGTGNGFTKFSGPTTAEKTFTLPDASATILTTNAAVTVAQGGTGLTSYTANGILYASGTTTTATGSALTFDGTNFSTTGSATATGFIPSSSTVPTNGMYLPAANAIGFATNSTYAARFDSSQNMLIGAAARFSGFTATNKLYVESTTADYFVHFRNTNGTAANCFGLALSYSTAPNGTGNNFIDARDSAAQRFAVRSNGGIANYQANDVNLSDARLKTNISPATPYLAKICAIPVVTFRYKDQTDSDLNLGVLAQDVEKIAPELVDSEGFGDTPYMAVYQTDLQYALMKALQELKAEFDEYKATHP